MSSSARDLSLSGLLNVGKLEDVIGSLIIRLERQDEVIQQLQEQLSLRPTQDVLTQMQQRLDEALEALERKSSATNLTIQKLERTIAECVSVTPTLEQCREEVKLKAGIDELEHLRTEIYGRLSDSFDELHSRKAESSIVADVTESQHRLFQEMVALQNVVSCKIDRVEVPLVQAAAEEVKGMIRFREDTNRRVSELTSQLNSVQSTLSEKENKETTVKRMQMIHDMLSRKADQDWTQDAIKTHIRQWEERSDMSCSVDQMRQLKSNQEEAHNRFRDLVEATHRIEQVLSKMDSQYTHMMTTLETKAPLSLVEKKMDTNEAEIQLEEIRQRTVGFAQIVIPAEEIKIHSAFISDIRNQLFELKGSHVDISKKVVLALKFMDWFTDMRLRT